MNQKKTGAFLKQLRKERNLTQEQLAENFYVSARTVSRWETGNNMPDLAVLVELADFYDVDIREIFDGERKSVHMNLETKDTLKKVAEYATEEKRKLRFRMADILAVTAIMVLFSAILFGTNAFNGAIPERSYHNLMSFILGFTFVALILNMLYLFGVFDRLFEKKVAFLNRKKK